MNGTAKQKGLTLIELMVAVVIGLLAIYAVYQVYEGTERTKRTIASVGDAQIAGLYSTFLMEEAIQNAGSGMMFNRVALINCPNNPIGSPGLALGTTTALSMKPLPVVIDPTANANFDDIYVYAGRPLHHIVPVTVSGGNAQTPFGFRQGTVLVDVQGGACNAYLVTADIAGLPAGDPIATPVGANISGAGGIGIPDGARLVDLGVPLRYRFFVDDQNTLQMEIWNLSTNGQWTRTRTDPIISGVMLLKAQYGIDTTVAAAAPGTGVTNWVQADAAPLDMATLRGLTTVVPVDQIKAVRLAIIVRADEPENPETFNQATTFTPFLDCPTSNGLGCLAMPPVPFAAGTGPNGTTYRYRMFEKVIPLRNTLWNQP